MYIWIILAVVVITVVCVCGVLFLLPKKKKEGFEGMWKDPLFAPIKTSVGKISSGSATSTNKQSNLIDDIQRKRDASGTLVNGGAPYGIRLGDSTEKPKYLAAFINGKTRVEIKGPGLFASKITDTFPVLDTANKSVKNILKIYLFTGYKLTLNSENFMTYPLILEGGVKTADKPKRGYTIFYFFPTHIGQFSKIELTAL